MQIYIATQKSIKHKRHCGFTWIHPIQQVLPTKCSWLFVMLLQYWKFTQQHLLVTVQFQLLITALSELPSNIVKHPEVFGIQRMKSEN